MEIESLSCMLFSQNLGSASILESLGLQGLIDKTHLSNQMKF